MATGIENLRQPELTPRVTSAQRTSVPAQTENRIGDTVSATRAVQIGSAETLAQLSSAFESSGDNLRALQQIRTLLSDLSAQASADPAANEQSLAGIVQGLLEHLDAGALRNYNTESFDDSLILSQSSIVGAPLAQAVAQDDLGAAREAIESIAAQVASGLSSLTHAQQQFDSGQRILIAPVQTEDANAFDAERANLLALHVRQELQIGGTNLTSGSAEQILKFFR